MPRRIALPLAIVDRQMDSRKTLPAFVISLDFELMWGVRDNRDKSSYGRTILGAREAIPRMLDLMEKHSIRATWATVGFVFCESKDELLAASPQSRPAYTSRRLSNYQYFDEVGDNERKDPYYFGGSLIDEISSCPGQEIGSHSFSHYYCLEPGQTVDQFDADTAAATSVAANRNITLKSFVFPRNQSSGPYLDVLRRRGFRVFRGNESSWLYKPPDRSGRAMVRRAGRLADQFINLTGHNTQSPSHVGDMVNLASSRFLRPYSSRFASLDKMRLRRLTASMTAAAVTKQIFHLWWHPHNFGVNISENIRILKEILVTYEALSNQHGMVSANMGDFA